VNTNADALNLQWPIWVGLVVEDFESQHRFYRDVLGLKEEQAGDGWAWFDLGKGRHFELLQHSDRPQYSTLGFRVGFKVTDIEAARAEMIARGVEAISEIDGTGEERWAYFRDPEGHIFEIKEYRETDDNE
jgi:catechol 2,3-dioxygenase-like lactoylglutathione lyase family enzyme